MSRQTTSDLLSRAFEEYGEVLEAVMVRSYHFLSPFGFPSQVFLIDGRGASGARCAFVRLSHLKADSPTQPGFKFSLDFAPRTLSGQSWSIALYIYIYIYT